MPLRHHLARWLARYGVAEIVGTCTALAGAWTVRALTGNLVLAAYGGALGENAGYYGCIACRDLLAARRVAVATGARLGPRHVGVVGREMAIEFGAAEVLDSLVVRPLMMGLGMRAIGGAGGVLAGKLAADVIFYLVVIPIHEARRQSRHAMPPR